MKNLYSVFRDSMQRWFGKILCFFFVVFFLANTHSRAQGSDTILITKQGEFEYSWTYSAYTALFDEQGDAFVYTASMELGLVTFDVSNVTNPIPVDTILPAQLNNLKLTNIFQFNDLLFGSLGSFQGLTQNAGLVIFNVSDPMNIVIEDVWDSVAFSEGSAIAITDGQYAYLGAMSEGIIILDVTDVQNIEYVSHLLPEPNFPEIPGPFSVPNARGLALKNADTLLVCNDAGGLRMLDVTDKFNPVEIGMYANAAIESTAQSAYNNVVLLNDYAYVPVDYCGLIVVDISSPLMQDVAWINPWNCNTINWDGNAGHSNQLVLIGDSLLFMSGGDSEILVFDISLPSDPILFGEYVYPFNMEVAWGLDVRNHQVVAAMVDNPFGVPYDSDWGGIQLFEWNEGYLTILQKDSNGINIFPNPASDKIYLSGMAENDWIIISDVSGKIIAQFTPGITEISCENLSSGLYFISVVSNDQTKQIFRVLIE